MIEQLAQLRQLLSDRFDEGELRTLCFDLGVDYADLPAEGKANKARELVAYLDRHDRILDLLQVGQRSRHDVDWSQVYLDDRMADYRARRDQTDQLRRERRTRQRVVNLRPLDVTHTFKDRIREMQDLFKYLAESSVRLVCVVGRGGMGKTALASRVLADLERGTETSEVLPDGILYLSARSTGLSLERIYADVGRMLGEPAASKLKARWASGDIPLVAKVEYLLEVMRDGLYLILLDNLEDNLTEDDSIAEEGLRLFVERCLTQPGGARLIATSREQVQVIPAALPSVRTIPLRDGLPEEAIALLRELDPQGELGLRDAPEGDLRQAVQLTGGIPRALEIIAGILQADSTSSLSRLLADKALFGEQVVESLVAASHHRLDENERCVMEALAVFDCPIEETAIAYLLHPWYPGLDVRGCLRRLANGYFVIANRATGAYNLHPLDREYAYRHLPDDNKAESCNRRNLELRAADFYASICKPASEWKTIEDLAPQLAEFEHRVRAGDYDGACRVLEPIDIDYLYEWGHYIRLIELHGKLLKRVVDSSLQVVNLVGRGRAHYALGEHGQAIRFYNEAISIAEKMGNRQRLGQLLGEQGRVYHHLGQFEKAIEHYVQVLDASREIGDRRAESFWLSYLAWTRRVLGDIDSAIRLYEDAISIARQTGARSEEGRYLGNLGRAYHRLGQIEEATRCYREGLDIVREVGNRRYESFFVGFLGNVSRDLGQVEEAI
jgi:tetratricopeptide (TPR) repeat protein